MFGLRAEKPLHVAMCFLLLCVLIESAIMVLTLDVEMDRAKSMRRLEVSQLRLLLPNQSFCLVEFFSLTCSFFLNSPYTRP
jgi:hypothetical protein